MVHRSDGSGTTFIFTDYLSKVSPEWKDKVGEDTSVEWPVGLGGKGNEGVVGTGRRAPTGAIGYVEYAYALQNKLVYAKLVNHDGATLAARQQGRFRPRPPMPTGRSAPGFYLILTDQPGKESWPITGATFILMHKKQDKPETAKQVLDFFDWAYKNGRQDGGIARLHADAAERRDDLSRTAGRQIIGPDGKPVWDGHAS